MSTASESLLPWVSQGRSVAVVGLSFGDESKGATVDFLAAHSPSPLVVRMNGGAQAAHNVVTPEGHHHTFSQLGSGTFTGARTFLSSSVRVDPLALATELAALSRLGVDALPLLFVSKDALLTTPYHRAANLTREALRGRSRHGSCGMGVGETTSYALRFSDAPRVGDCLSPSLLTHHLTTLRSRLEAELGVLDAPPVEDVVDAFTAFAQAVRIVPSSFLREEAPTSSVIFEGAQGVLLDQDYGFHPYTTWSRTTFAEADRLAGEAGLSLPFRLGLLRSYTTRHGAGPFPSEDPLLTADIPDSFNTFNPHQETFRVGHLDLPLVRYALAATGGVDALSLSHLDVLAAHPELQVVEEYEEGDLPLPTSRAEQEEVTRRVLAARPILSRRGPLEALSDLAPLLLTASGPTRADRSLLVRS